MENIPVAIPVSLKDYWEIPLRQIRQKSHNSFVIPSPRLVHLVQQEYCGKNLVYANTVRLPSDQVNNPLPSALRYRFHLSVYPFLQNNVKDSAVGCLQVHRPYQWKLSFLS
ncbi:hypothetical protein D3C80_1351640 [compost metagenome]